MTDTPTPDPVPTVPLYPAQTSAQSMARARFHAERASEALGSYANPEMASAHAQTSRAWSAIGRDQAITEAAARRGTPVGRTPCPQQGVRR